MKTYKFILAIVAIWGISWYLQLPSQMNENIPKTYEDSLYIEYIDYRFKADSMLSKYNSKITGEMLAEGWLETKREYSVDVPLELALAQAQLESSFGNSRLALVNKNPYNIMGKGGFAKYSSMNEGVKAYYKLMATNYLRCKSKDELLRNFTNCNGHRYASSDSYEVALRRQINRYNMY
jgi:hypothetical protein